MKKKIALWALIGMVVGGQSVWAQKVERRLTKGEWEVLAVQNAPYSETTLDSLKRQGRRGTRGTEKAVYKFDGAGSFQQSHPAAAPVAGTYSLKEEKMLLKRKWELPEGSRGLLGLKKGKAKERIQYLKRGYLVLEGRQETLYLRRARRWSPGTAF